MTPSEESLAKLPAEGAQLYEGLRQYLLEIDSNLVRLDKILSRLQPPVSGRVRLAWRKDGSSLLTERRPILVQWKKIGEKLDVRAHGRQVACAKAASFWRVLLCA